MASKYDQVNKKPSQAGTDPELSVPPRSPSGPVGKSLVKHIASSAVLSFGSGTNSTVQDKRFGKILRYQDEPEEPEFRHFPHTTSNLQTHASRTWIELDASPRSGQ